MRRSERTCRARRELELNSAYAVLSIRNQPTSSYDHAIRIIKHHLSASTSVFAAADLVRWQQMYERRMNELRELIFARHPELRLRPPKIESIDMRRL